MSVRVLYDHQIFVGQNVGGISRYFYEIIKFLDKESATDIGITAFESNNKYIIRDDSFRLRFGLKEPSKKQLLSKIGYFLAGNTKNTYAKNTIDRLNNFNPDVFHPTYYGNYYIGEVKKTKVVLTVYDMIHEKFPELFSVSDKTYQLKRSAILSADHLICISESTRRDLVDYYNIPLERTSVVYLGSTFEKCAEEIIASHRVYDFPFVLYVGSRDKYKNFNFSLRGLRRVFNDNPRMKLVIFGGGRLTLSERHFLNDVLGNRYIVVENTSDEFLRDLYKAASALLYPSYYEGFGIPILEAFALDCPVVCARVSSIPEVAMEAGFYFEPKNVTSLELALVNAVKSKKSTEVIQRQKNVLSRFGWEDTARQTLEVYRKISGKL
jgi:glycosyltransferase involved in cell wall biosynthesis